MASSAPVAYHHLFREEDIPCDVTMESNFPWQHLRIYSCGKDFDMPLSISDILIKFVSAFVDRHFISEIREGKFHCLVTNKLRQIDSNEGRFLPISERTDAFMKIRLYI